MDNLSTRILAAINSNKIESGGDTGLKRAIREALRAQNKPWLRDIAADVYYPISERGYLGKPVPRYVLEDQGISIAECDVVYV